MNVSVEINGGGDQWEATATGDWIPDYGYHWASTDVITLLAAVARDLHEAERTAGP